MRWSGVYVDAVALVLGELEPVEDAIAAGRYSATEAAKSRQRSVAVSRDRSGPELAVAAGREALHRAGRRPAEIGLLVHASCWLPGVEFWNVASYLQNEVIGHGEATAFELRQMSNGGMSALALAARQLGPGTDAALITTGDRFAEPAFPRWTADSGLVFGDAGTAVIVSRRQGIFELVATAGYAEPGLERQHRGAQPFLASWPDQGPIDLVARRKDFFRLMPSAEVMARSDLGVLTAVKRCLADAAVDLAGLAVVVVPFFGTELSGWQCFGPLGIPPERTLHDWGLRIGHLGAGDQFAGLALLTEEDRLAAGDHVLLVGIGAGFVWTCAVLRKV